MKREAMIKKIRSDSALQEALDEIVIDRYSALASDLNNLGPKAQLKWLDENCGEDIDEIFAVISA
jgi:hypothetical protein